MIVILGWLYLREKLSLFAKVPWTQSNLQKEFPFFSLWAKEKTIEFPLAQSSIMSCYTQEEVDG